MGKTNLTGSNSIIARSTEIYKRKLVNGTRLEKPILTSRKQKPRKLILRPCCSDPSHTEGKITSLILGYICIYKRSMIGQPAFNQSMLLWLAPQTGEYKVLKEGAQTCSKPLRNVLRSHRDSCISAMHFATLS